MRYRPAPFRCVEANVFDGLGTTAASPPSLGLYFLGLLWLQTWGSGRFGGIARDSEYLSERVVSTARLAKA
ncbi:MAG: hypothetical protein CMK74_01730 [Pseudomonadales bacterium]|nr:hypothetical protein [Pseudomonadales bacterium]